MKYAAFLLFFILLPGCLDPGSTGSGSSPDGPAEIYFPPSSSDEWETITPDSLGWEPAAIPDLLNFLETSGTRAFLVLKNGRIVIEEYFNTDMGGTNSFTSESLWYWASAGKTLTSCLVGKAQEEGYLGIDDSSADYLGHGWSSLTDIQEEIITVRHHITMTTGLDDSVANSDSTLPGDLIFLAAPGTRWAYHNAPYTILDRVIEGATGTGFTAYFNEKLRDPIGMEGSWFWLENNHVFFSTARSMARFGILILARGNWAGDPVLADTDYYNEMINTSQDLNLSYGYLWWLNGKTSYMLPGLQTVLSGSLTPNAPSDLFAAMGKDGQILNIIPSAGLIIVRMGDNSSGYMVPTAYQTDLWEKLNAVIEP